MKQLVQCVRRALQARPLAMAIATVVALAIVFVFAFTPDVVSAQGSTCSEQVVGTRFTLPAMRANEEAVVPPVNGATAICIEGLEGSEGVALKLKGTDPYLAEGNATPLTVDAEFATSMALSGPSFNGSILRATPTLVAVKIVALTDLTEGVTLFVGVPKVTTVAPVQIEQWAPVVIPGALGELKAGTTKWSGNGVSVVITSGAAFSVNGTAVLPEPGKTGKYELMVSGTQELKLAGTVPGQRFYLEVKAESLAADAWLQRRVDPAPATTSPSAASTAGAQYVDAGGTCFSTSACTTGQAVACSSGAPKLPCTAGNDLEVWRPPQTFTPMNLWSALRMVR